MQTVKAIFFDLDETLIENQLSVTDVFGRVYSDFAHELGPNQRKTFFGELRESAQNVWATMFERDMGPESQLVECFERSIAATNNVKPEQHLSLAQDMFEHFLYLSSNNVRFQDNALGVLNELEDRGFITGVITNGIEQVQLGKIRQLGIDTLVHHINISAQARAHKPLHPVFDQATNKAGVAASDAWMIGDHPTNDVAGSIRAGFTGIYYNPKQHNIERAFADLDERPNHVITSLADIFTLLD